MDQDIVKKFEIIVDDACSQMKIWSFNRDEALRFVGVEAERASVDNKNTQDEKRRKITGNRIFYITNWLLKQIHLRCPLDGGLTISDLTLDQYNNLIRETFLPGDTHAMMFEIFPSFWNGIYKVDREETDDNKITFKYKNDSIAHYEASNGIFLDRFNKENDEKFQVFSEMAPKNDLEDYSWFMADKWVDLLFSIPGEYKISDYTVDDLKKVLKNLYFAATLRMAENIKTENIEILLLNEHDWDYNALGIDKNTFMKIIDDLTFTSMSKSEQEKANPFLAPIFTLREGRVLIPHFLLQNSVQRNLLTSLVRKYEEANHDSELRLSIVTNPLNQFLSSNFPHLLTFEQVPLNGSDLDYIIYDTNTHHMTIFEIKSFNEPITALEIKNKDKDITKGIQQQLLKHREFLSEIHNLDGLANKLEIPKIEESSYFLLTENTIGSGYIDRNEINTVNLRMFMQSLTDTSGQLKESSNLLNENRYMPQENIDYAFDMTNYTIENIQIHAEGIIYL